MTFTDPIGDMFSRIRNGQMRSLNSVLINGSKVKKSTFKLVFKKLFNPLIYAVPPDM